MRIKISDSEQYDVRRREDERNVSFLFSPYSCLNPISIYLDKNSMELYVYLRSELIYKGLLDLLELRKELERRMNCLEVSTILNFLNKEPMLRNYVMLNPFDKLLYSLAYGSLRDFKKVLEELSNQANFEDLIKGLENLISNLPEKLKEPLLKKLSSYTRKKNYSFSKPLIRKKRRRKVMVYESS